MNDNFRKDMDKAYTIDERIESMKIFHDNRISTTCFISHIFPEITDVFEIIEKVKKYYDYIWLENLNLRGNFKTSIMDYINRNYPERYENYNEIYNKNKKKYWVELSDKIERYAKENDYLHVIAEELFIKNTKKNPVIINYFYYSKIK